MKILCFGDSNTYGYDPCSFLGGRYPAEHRWPDLLAAQTGWDIVNAGENGREIPRQPYAIENTLRLVEREKCSLFCVMLGTNDLLQGAPAEKVCARMKAFLTRVVPLCPQILLVAPPAMKRGAWVAQDALVEESVSLAAQYRVLARQLEIRFADASRWNVGLTFDGVHFTEEGHKTFAEHLRQELGK